MRHRAAGLRHGGPSTASLAAGGIRPLAQQPTAMPRRVGPKFYCSVALMVTTDVPELLGLVPFA